MNENYGFGRSAASVAARKHFGENAINRCQTCGWVAPRNCRGSMPGLHVHHMLPVAAGGGNEITNLVLVCRNCHFVAHSLWGNHGGGPTERDAFIGRMRIHLEDKPTRYENLVRVEKKRCISSDESSEIGQD